MTSASAPAPATPASPESLARDSSRLATIDALRGVEAIAVLLSHLPFSAALTPTPQDDISVNAFPRWLSVVLDHGFYGVHLFLLISGFCIHMAWARQPESTARISLTQFWKRRLHRLYPPYFAALLLTIAGLYVANTYVVGARGSIATHLGYSDGAQLAVDLLLLLLLAQNVNNASRRIGNSPFWTLALEEQLYVLYFPLLWMRRNWSWTRTLLVVALVTLTWRTIGVLAPSQVPMLYLGPARWFEWTLGALAVEAYLGRVKLPAWCRSGGVAAVLLVAAVALVNAPRFVPATTRPLAPISELVVGVALFVAVNAACEARWAGEGSGLVGRFFAWVGTFSYSLYLTHELVVVAAKQVAMRAGLGTLGIVVARLLLPIAGGWLFYMLVERRFLNASRREATRARR